MAQKIIDNNRKPYNNVPLREGEVLVPQLVDDRAYAIAIGADPVNLRTYTTAGVSYLVMFVAVPKEHEAESMKAYYAAVNELLDEKLGPNRASRCLIPQADGTKKVCPKLKDGNHEPCDTCPHRGEYEREDRSMVSLQDLDDENYAPMESAPSAEDEALLGIMLDDLLEYLGGMNPMLADVVRMGYDGMTKKDIVRNLPVKSSQAYDLFNKAHKLSMEYLRK